MSARVDAMPLATFLRRMADVALDAGLLLFAAFVAFALNLGLGILLSGNRALIVPAIILVVFATSALTKYATLATRAIALGYDVPAADNAVFDYFRYHWAFAPWAALVILAALGWGVRQYLGQLAFTGYLLIVLPLLPAAIAVICVNTSLLTLLRVGELLRVIRILGVDYLKILAGWFVILGLGVVLPLEGYLAVLLLCAQLLWLFTSTGVVLYHHYLPLGIPVERLPADERVQRRADAATLRERQAALDEAYGYFSRGNEPGGLKRLRTYLEAHDDHDAWGWFADRTRDWESPRPFLLVAKNYLPRLVATGNDGEALALLVHCMRIDPDFAPRPEDRARLRALLEGHAFADRAARWR